MMLWLPICTYCRTIMLALTSGWFCPLCSCTRAPQPYSALASL